ncbi:MAG: vWA domain-containing protein [Planctomycetaceae bacterium]
MNLASPDRLIWLLIAIPIVLLYILRTRLRKKSVATLLFWDQLFDEKRQRSLWQRLRHWISLLLQLAFLLLVTAALIDPLWKGQRENAREVVIVLDNSASMRAGQPDGENRFEQAKKLALELVATLRDGDEAALVTAGSSVRVAAGMTDFPPAIRDAIHALELTDGPTKIIEAVETARRLTRSETRRDLVVLSDFCFDNAAKLEDDKDVRLMPVGESQDNIGITSLAVRRSLVDPIGFAALIGSQNFGKHAIECRLSVNLGDELVDVFPLKLAAGQAWTKSIVGASAEGGVLRVTLGIQDALPTDNQAIAVLPPRPKIPVVLVTQEPSLYLESVMRAIPQVELSLATVPPKQSPEHGFVVLHRVVPRPLPTGRVLAIDPREDGDAWALGDEISQAIVAKQDSDSPLMPHVRLINVILPNARALEMKKPATPLLVDANGKTVMASIVDGDNRLVVLSANLDSSDLPLRIAFPVMMTNAVNWFLGRNGEIQPAMQTGQRSDIELPAATTEPWALRNHGGQITAITVADQRAHVGPIDHVGLVEVGPKRLFNAEADDQHDDSILPVAVNLCNPSESDLSPRVAVDRDDPARARIGQRSLWFYLAFLALGLIVGEWFLYQRRIVG